MQSFHIWQFIAGIAVFIYAMSMIENSLKNLAGRSFKKYLQKQSKRKFKMMLSSTIVTAFLQSSSVVLLMVLSFVGAGLLNLRGALAAVLGSNLGTTLDSWVIALIGFKIDFSAISYPVLAISLIGLLLSGKNTKLYQLTQFFIGFAFIFISLEWLKSSVDKTIESDLLGLSHLPYLAFLPIGFLITAIIQSSSVTIAITLTSLYNHLIPFESAAAIVIGSELGTTVKFLLGSIGGISDKKRVAWGNFILNLVTLILAALFLFPLIYLIQNIFYIQDPMIALVVFQTSINLLSILLFFPFLGVLANFLERRFKDDSANQLTLFIRKADPALPGDPLELAEKETIHLMNETIELNREILGIHKEKKEGWIQNLKKFASDSTSYALNYGKIKMLHGEILEYITEFPKSELSETEMVRIGKLVHINRHILRSAKNIKDIIHNLEEFESTANDYLFNLLLNIKSKQKKFYGLFQTHLNETTALNPDTIDHLMTNNRKQYDALISEMLQFLKENKIKELDSSNLINVFREMYSSNKALIQALGDIHDIDLEDS
jgi:phosphate:Na+ symporter